MSSLFAGRAARIAVTAGVALASISMTAGLALASGQAQRSDGPLITTIDHQLCYLASAKGFKVPGGIVLKNQLNPAGFRPRITSVALHCNPVEKAIKGGATFGITNPSAHLLCFAFTTAR
jgi:hypothetical protein